MAAGDQLLRAVIDGLPRNRDATTILTGANGQPVKVDHFKHEWRKATLATDLDGYNFHGLRHTSGQAVADGGGTEDEIMAVLGHTDAARHRFTSAGAPARRAAAALIWNASGVDAVEGVFGRGRTSALRRPTSQGRSDERCVPRVRHLAEDWRQAVHPLQGAGRPCAHPMASKTFSDGEAERSLIWQDKDTGLWLKARPDWIKHGSTFVPNYKTSRSVKPDDWPKDAYRLGYHQGAALTAEG